MSRSDRFEFTLDEETEKRLYDLLTDMDTRNTDRFWIKDKRGYHAEYVKVIRCKDCKHYEWSDNRAFGYPTKRCEWTGFEDMDNMDYCSRAERKEK